MQGDDLNTTAWRFYTMLHFQIAAQMPRPGGVHIYSKGSMYANLVTKHDGSSNKWTITVSQGVPYSGYAMGYDDQGKRMTPRIPKPTINNPHPKHLEEMNFKVIPRCINTVANAIAFASGGKVVVK